MKIFKSGANPLQQALPTDFDPKSALLTLIAVPLGYFILRRLSSLVLKASKYIIGAILTLTGKTVMHSLAGRISMRTYCKYLLRGPSSVLHVPGGRDTQLYTDEMFVPLLMQSTLATGSDFTSSTLLEAGSRIQVIGDPGSGKSSLMKRLLRDAARQGLESPTKARLPMSLDLSKLVPPKNLEFEAFDEWALTQIRTQLMNSSVYEPEELFISCGATRGLLVLLDGFDEVPTSDYANVLAAINAISRELDRLGPNNILVITMRTSFHRQIAHDLRDTFPVTLHVRGFTPADIFEFLNRWPFDARDSSASVARIYAELTDRPTLREMCSNPLVLAMYVADDQSGSGTAGVGPESRTEFYEKVVEELLVLRRRRQGATLAARNALREQREAILGRLSFDHLLDSTQPANSISWRTATTVVQTELGCEFLAAEEFLADLMKETGIFSIEREGQSFRFIHLTFCEFFAALEAARGRVDGMSSLVSAYSSAVVAAEPDGRSRLTEVVPFAVGLSSRADRAGILDAVAANGEWSVVARCILETQAYENAAWRSMLRAELDALKATPDTDWDAEWLSRLHLAAVVVADAENVSGIKRIAAPDISIGEFYGELVSDHKERLMKLFASMARQDAAAAFRLASATGVDLLSEAPSILIDAMQEPAFLSLALNEAAGTAQRTTEWVLVFAEAALRFRAVASTLLTVDSPSSWHRAFTQIPPRRRWSSDYTPTSTLMSVAITLGVDQVKKYPASEIFKALSLLTQIPAPGAYPYLLRRITNFGILSIFVIYSFWLTGKVSSIGFNGTSIALVLLLYVGMVLALWVAGGVRYWGRVYNDIVGLTDSNIILMLSPMVYLPSAYASPLLLKEASSARTLSRDSLLFSLASMQILIQGPLPIYRALLREQVAVAKAIELLRKTRG